MNIYDEIFASDPNYNAVIDYKLDVVLGWVKKNNFRHLLDVGCGRGHYLKLLSEKGIKVTGLEPSKFIADTLKDYEVVNDDILGLGKKGKEWEALICMDALEHIEPTEIEETIKALASLSPRALLGIANHSDKWRGTELHLIREDPWWWVSLLSKHYRSVKGVYTSKRYFMYEAIR